MCVRQFSPANSAIKWRDFFAGREHGQFQLGREETAVGRQRRGRRRAGRGERDGRFAGGGERERTDARVEREESQRRVFGRRVGLRVAAGRNSRVQRTAARAGQRVRRRASRSHRFHNSLRHVVSPLCKQRESPCAAITSRCPTREEDS